MRGRMAGMSAFADALTRILGRISAPMREAKGDLLDIRMADGSRHFAEVPWQPPLMLKQRLLDASNGTLTGFLYSTAETCADFEYAGHSFTAHNPTSDFWLFVRDPLCPDNVLREVKGRLRGEKKTSWQLTNKTAPNPRLSRRKES